MSYEIVKSIKIKDNKVFINYASNNVYPRHFEEFESKLLSAILQKDGQDVLDLEIMKAYESGCFQRGSNKYVRALHILRHMPEYGAFDWRNNDKDYAIAQKNREDETAFNAILKKALNSRLPKDKFIISKPYNDGVVYLWKITKNSAKWCYEKIRAKIFNYQEDADGLKHCFNESENWLTEKIA